MKAGDNFFNFYNHDFVRVAVGIPAVRVADPAFNATQTIALMRDGAERRAMVVLFPELGLTAYSCDDLFQQRAVLDAAEDALREILDASRTLNLVAVVGMPVRADNSLFNCAVAVSRGRILAAIPKTYPPNYREFYELRQFAPAASALGAEINLAGQAGVAFGTRILLRCEEQPWLVMHAEICEDLWTPIAPSAHAALAGATVMLNLSASNITVAKADYRRELVASQSARCIGAYLYSAAGPGESTTDLAWDGHAIICENGAMLAESQRFSDTPQLVCAEIDLERLTQERMRQTSFGDCARAERESAAGFRSVGFSLEIPRRQRMLLERGYERFPYVPADPAVRDQRCAEVYEIQVQGLANRLRYAGIERVVIGVSGGLDSTHALLVCAQAMDRLRLPRRNILAYTMPGFATSARTLAQARSLMAVLGCSAGEIDIRPSAQQMLSDIGHPFANGLQIFDVTFENVQAGERTSHLFRLANLNSGLVVGTGDLSELALGWCTYGVGDHMSHYAVNASVPKTLMQYVVRWVAETGRLGPDAGATLLEILSTPISPELVPGRSSEGDPEQRTEAIIGPYELQDFNLYYTLRFGYAPPKIAFLAYSAWRDRALGRWPAVPENARNQYPIGKIKSYLKIFLTRFFAQSQFKRSCIPNAPKVGSGGSLSPRGDWRAPSDSGAQAWLAALDLVPGSDIVAAPKRRSRGSRR
ncbi:MAG TPA: NAD(+) synthase [Candidatus Binataceae bacterium]|nr:NAD(+) synthase [Candidatus Binataceae bacterium]